MRIAREEIFGPVLVAIAFDDDEDAVRIANDSEYGLSGPIFSADPDRALRIARRIRSGTLNVNGANFFAPAFRSAATSKAASAAKWGCRVSRNTCSPSTSPFQPTRESGGEGTVCQYG